MNFGELTIAQILLSAFSGIGIIILSWIFGKKVIGRLRVNSKQNAIVQYNNKVHGDMAGGSIASTSATQDIETKQRHNKIDQVGNVVGGDIAGGNIVKEDHK
jgi:hypothetical protein